MLKKLLPPMPWYAIPLYRHYLKKQTHAQGMGRHTLEELQHIGRMNLRALSDFMGMYCPEHWHRSDSSQSTDYIAKENLKHAIGNETVLMIKPQMNFKICSRSLNQFLFSLRKLQVKVLTTSQFIYISFHIFLNQRSFKSSEKYKIIVFLNCMI